MIGRAKKTSELVNDVVAMPGYDFASQAFHWLTALLMLGIVMPIGIYAAWIGDGPLRTYLLEHWHKPFGLLIAVLTLGRLVWKGHRATVADAVGLKAWELGLAKLPIGFCTRCCSCCRFPVC